MRYVFRIRETRRSALSYKKEYRVCVSPFHFQKFGPSIFAFASGKKIADSISRRIHINHQIFVGSRRFHPQSGSNSIFIEPMILYGSTRRARSRARPSPLSFPSANSYVTRRDFLRRFFARRPNNQIRISSGARHVLLHREEAVTPCGSRVD